VFSLHLIIEEENKNQTQAAATGENSVNAGNNAIKKGFIGAENRGLGKRA